MATISILIFLAVPDRHDAQDGREMLQCNVISYSLA